MKQLLVSILLLFLAVMFLVPWYLGPDDLKSCKTPEPAGTCGAVDAIIVVSGGDTNARTDEAIKIYNQGWSNLLIVSGAAADSTGPSNASMMAKRAEAAGVPYHRIITEEFARDTKENAENTAKFIEGLGLNKVIIVTSAYHQRRATLEFGSILGQNVTVLSHPVQSDKQWSGLWWWTTPSGWWLAIGELLKIMAFYSAEGVRKL